MVNATVTVSTNPTVCYIIDSVAWPVTSGTPASGRSTGGHGLRVWRTWLKLWLVIDPGLQQVKGDDLTLALASLLAATVKCRIRWCFIDYLIQSSSVCTSIALEIGSSEVRTAGRKTLTPIPQEAP